MSWNESPSELVKRVTETTVKSIAGETDLEVSFVSGNEAGAAASRTSVRLPCPPETNISVEDLTRLRGAADAVALRIRYHDANLHRRRRPAGQQAAQVFERAEQVRVEALDEVRHQTSD